MASRKSIPVKQPITGEKRIVGPGFREHVYSKVKTVPRGHVTTYGDVAGALGSRRVARQVGFALSALDKSREHEVPWQRVINSQGCISFKDDVFRATLQKKLLRKEGADVDDDGRVLDFAARRFVFPAPRAARATA